MYKKEHKFVGIRILLIFAFASIISGVVPAQAESLSSPLNTSGNFIGAKNIGGTDFDDSNSSAINSNIHAQTWTSTHQITYFQGNKPSAISISFDDGLPYQAQDTNGVSELNARGLKGTFFVVTDWIDQYWRDSWPTWQSVAAQGHEVASHTVTHPDLTTLSDNEVRQELSKSQSDMNQNIPGQNTISFSYPHTAENSTVDAIAGEYYVASRVAWAKEGAYLNYYQPFSDADGSYSTVNFNTVAAMEMDGLNATDPDFNSRLDKAVLHHAWFNLYFHDVSDPTDLGNILDYVQGKQSFWIDTIGNVSRYMKERLNSTIQVIADTPSEIRLQIAMNASLPTSIYNVPLTLRSTVPTSWTQVIVQQGNASQTIIPVIEGSDTVIYYNALPNAGDIVLIPLNPVLGLTSLNPASAFVGGSSFTLTVTGTNFVNGSIVRWNNSDRATTYISTTQLTASISASDIASINTADVRVFNPAPDEGTSNQLYFAVTAKPITVTVIPGQSKTYGSADPIFTYLSSNPAVTFTGALSRVVGENVDAYNINQGSLAVVDSNYAITSFVPANFAITPKPITITVSPGQSKIYGDADPIFTYTSSDPAATFTGALSRVVGENVGSYALNQGTLAITGNNYTIASFVPANFAITSSTTNANLSNLVFNTGTLSPTFTFASGITTFTQSVAYTVASLTVTPTVADAAATIKVNGTAVASGSASGLIALAVGSNTITTVVTAQDGTTTKTYTVTVTRAAPSINANLSGLTFSTGVLTPTFAAGTTTYTQSVAYTVTSLTITPTVANAAATIKVNGTTVASGSASGSIALAVGSNTITTIVTAQDGTTTKIYTVTVTRAAPSTNANLNNLVFSTGTLSPAFAAGTTDYAQSVTNAITSLTVTPTIANAAATIKVNGTTVASGSVSGPIALAVGSNTITTVVTAQDGTSTKGYIVTVTRAAPSTNANLNNLVFSTGTLSPAFATGTTDYVQSVTNATTSLTVTPTVANAAATIKVNGTAVASGSVSGPIALVVGSNTITAIVTAQDGTTTKIYTVTVTRASSTNANLSGLVFSTGILTPAFASGTTTYTQSVAYAVTSLTITPTVADAAATITVNGTTVTSGNASGSITLVVGSNTITTIVTAQDGTTIKTYTVTVTRAPNPAKDITTFSFTSPAATGVITGTNIAVAVPYGTDITALVATFTTTGTFVKVDSTTQVSGTTANNFTSPVTYRVTAADTTTKDYMVTVTVAANPAKDVTAFSFTSPAATGLITGTNIAVTVPFGTNVTSLVATFTTTGASVKVGGTTQVSGTTANNFTSPVTYRVTAADTTTKDYTVAVTVAANPAKDITAFSFATPAATGTIDEDAHTIAVTVPFGTNVTALVANFTTTGPSVRVGATLQVSGVTANDFTNSVIYTVTAADLSTKAYTVIVTIAPNPAKDITAFSFATPAMTGVITGTNIALTVPFGTNVTALAATFTTTGVSVKVGETTQISGTTANNFSNPVTYTVIAANGTTQNYIVTVTVAPNPAKDITTFSFTSLTATGVFTGTNIAITVPFGTDVTALVPTITHNGVSISPNSGVARDFTNPVAYRVTAADASTQDYTVTVTRAMAATSKYQLFLPLILR